MNHETSYRAEIDGLRALAVIAVIINHLDKNILPSGYLGIDIFFVISGFVITSSLASHPVQNFGGFLAGFYIRRIKRLVPALVLFVVISSVLACLFSPNPSASLKTGSASLFGLSNLYLLWQSTDYFAESTKLNIFTHTWSLGAEEQFYVLFPFVFWFTGFGRLAAKGSKKLFITMGVLSVASLISFVYLYQTNQPAAYFLMPTRFWEIGAGCLLFLGLKHSNRFPRALTLAPPLVITFAIIAVLFAPLHFAVAATIAVVVLTVTLIACIRPGTVAHRLFSHKLLVYIGSLSYSLYLWHWSILSISSRTIGAYLWMAPVQVALMFLPSMASYKYVETPLRRSMWSPSRIRTIAYGLSGLALAGLFVLFLSFNARHLSLFKENKEMNYATHWE
ncbi:MAG: acyltransferase family protein, partial [Chloroflexota bacterium]